MLLPALLLALAPASASNDDLLIQLRDAEGWTPLATLAPGERKLLLAPLTSRSERVRRLVPGARGLGLRLSAAGAGAGSGVQLVRASAIAHPRAWRVLLDDEQLLLVGPPVLPASVSAGALASLARRDAHGPLEGMLVVQLSAASLAEGEQLVLIAREDARPGSRVLVVQRDDSTELELEPGPNHARVLPVEAGELRIQGDVEALDQLSLALVRAIDDDAKRALELRDSGRIASTGWRSAQLLGQGHSFESPRVRGLGFGAGALPALARPGAEPLRWNAAGGLDLWFASPPATQEQHTWSVLLELRAAEGLGTTEASAPSDEPASSAWLVDHTRAAGLHFAHLEGPEEQLDIRPTMGPGAAWGDADGDGWNDLYLVQGGGRGECAPLANQLFLNSGDGRLRDSSAQAGCADAGGHGMGALFFDAEGDADLDLYVANYGPDALFENDGAAHFQDVRREAGVGGERWSAGVCAGDYDRDGDLDLYVTSYLEYDEALMPPPDELQRFQREDPIAMLPFAFPGQANTFLENTSELRSQGASGLRFVDRTEELGLIDVQGRGMQAVFWDFDRDAWPDLYVANDVSYNVLFRNTGGSFEDVSFATGVDDPRGGMGLAVGDTDGDGDEDLFLTNWELEANALYLNNVISHRSQRHHRASFQDAIVKSGLGPFGVGATSWGAALFDLENDGDLDLYVANGYTSPDYEGTGICLGQPDHLFLNDGEGRFEDGRELAAGVLRPALPSRCAVGCDYDQDGDVDLLVTANNAPARLLANQAPRAGRWLGLRLSQEGKNPFAVGAEVTLQLPGLTLRRQLLAGTSYLGGNAPELFFGLGAVDRVDTLSVRWPDGATTTHAVDALDRWTTITR